MLRAFAVWTIRGYQRLISRYTPAMCRFEPTCSQYAVTAVGRFGVLRGGWMAALRLGRCHPFHPGGYDPVPGLPHEGCQHPGHTHSHAASSIVDGVEAGGEAP